MGTRAEHVFASPPCDGVGTLLQGPDENRARLRRFYGAKHPVPTLIFLLTYFFFFFFFFFWGGGGGGAS